MEEIESLVRKAAATDRPRPERLAAFGTLVERFRDMAFGYAYAVLGDFHHAEDAAQEAFLAAFRELANLRRPEAFAGWLRRIVHTACSRMTRRKRVATSSLSSAADAAARGAGPARAAENNEMRDEVLAAVRALPPAQREVTALFYINGYSQREIAAFLELPATTVNNRLAASRKRLKQRMLKMVEDTLHAGAPDERFSRKVIESLLSRPRLLQIEGHPVRQIVDATRSALGDYEWIEGEEVVSAEALVDAGAPADGTYRLNDAQVLRPETTVTTFRAMAGRTPPVRLITAGRVFRADPEDAGHQKVFHQLDALCVEAGADEAAMKSAVRAALEAAIGRRELQWQPHDFGCVEGGLAVVAQMDAGPVEVGGCGLLTRRTLRGAGFDPGAVGGFAFGVGLERLAMLKHGIDDIRTLWQPPYVST